MENKMFCFQCEERANNVGCSVSGACGKKPEIAKLQDLLVYVTKGLASVLKEMRREGLIVDKEINHIISSNLFITITNANFDKEKIVKAIEETINIKDKLVSKIKDINNLNIASKYSENRNDFLDFSENIGVLSVENEDIRSLKEMIMYGLKGLSAYLKHANALLFEDQCIDEFLQDTLSILLEETLSIDELINLTMKTGEYGVKAMELLDRANTSTYGDPEITHVNIGVRKNPGILVSGHDLKDLEDLLDQTKDTGVDIYTHSEMLAGHYYPMFKKYSHFVGNYGNAWWKQREEFEKFNGPILMTTNCIVPPLESYKNRLWTTGAAGYEGCKHIDGKYGEKKDFSEIIKQAKECKSPIEIEKGEIIGGFAHECVLSIGDKVVEAIKNGDIKRFIVMAGCDGRKKEREYYTEFAKKLPKDTVILTAGCAKYRYNKLNLGDINGIPRVLDAGQCNDSYSLVLIALKLKEVFKLNDINELPIVYNIAWYEQKAVIVLLSLLYLGVKNIHIGPTLPGFLSDNVGKILVEKFNISKMGSVEEDLELFNLNY